MATDPYVSAQQKRWEAYLAQHAIEKVFRDLTSSLITQQPAEPLKFMVDYLRRMQAGASEAKDSDDAQAKDAKDSDSSDSDDEDEDDYADFVETKLPVVKRVSVVARNVVEDNFTAPVYAKKPEQTKLLSGIVRSICFMTRLTRKEISVLVGAMKSVSFSEGDEIIQQGEEGDMFYIVEEGSCDISVSGVGKVMSIPCPSKEDATVQRRYFGELALLYDAPRAASVAADTAVAAWTLDRSTFKSIMQDTAEKKVMLYSKFIQSIPAFRDLTVNQTHTLCCALTGVDYDTGDVVITEGDHGNEFFMIETGKAECLKQIAGQETSVAVVRAGDFFGERALQTDEPRAATVRALTPLSVVKIDRPTFKRMLGSMSALERNYDH